MIGLFLLTKKDDKVAALRLFDFFSISFLSSLPLGFLGYFLLSKSKLFSFSNMSLIVAYLVLFIVFIKILLPRLLNSTFKDGTLGFLFLICFSVITIVENLVGRGGGRFYLNLEDLILLIMLCTSVAFLIKQEKLLSKFKKLDKVRKRLYLKG